MRLASAIPSQVVAGRTMALPVIVLFSQCSETPPSISDIWVFVSLIDEDAGGALREDVLRGKRADSIHMLSELNATVEDSFAYASFTDLEISTQ